MSQDAGRTWAACQLARRANGRATDHPPDESSAAPRPNETRRRRREFDGGGGVGGGCDRISRSVTLHDLALPCGVETMIARAFGLVDKAWKRTPASTPPRRRSNLPALLRRLHSRPAQPEIFREEGPLLQNNSGGAPPRLDFISEQNMSKQCYNVNTVTSADSAVDSIRDTVEGSFDQRFATLKSIGKDRVKDSELELLLKKKSAPVCYVWFDPTPFMRISQGIMTTLSVNKMVKSGCKVKILMADWIAQMNRNIGGNLSEMRTIGLYNIEMWKAAGMALDRVEIVWLSDEISRLADEYWPLAIDVARKTTVSRIKRYCERRDLIEEITAADIFYLSFQCATILFQKVDIWLLGMDQHEANLLAREYCKCVKRRNKPVAVSYKGNPCLEYIKYIILPWYGKFEVVREKEDGGNKTFLSMEEITADYVSGVLHPGDMKLALAKSLIKILQPVHDHFRSNAEAKKALQGIELGKPLTALGGSSRWAKEFRIYDAKAKHVTLY
uniref:Tyrosine--tRNA ligase n=1 Tax=Oryza meridionalis TaxID=40149 RepID=A0A0E0CAS3_9ORYZ